MKKLFVLTWVILAACAAYGQNSDLSRQVEIIRTAHGVPHIRAKNLRAAGYALAWVQCEDYGTRTPLAVLSASGRRASVEGREYVESDFFTMQHRARVMKNYDSLSKDVREVYEGFAAGINRYIELHRADFPAAMPADFTARDVAATEIIPMPARKVRNFLNRLGAAQAVLRDAASEGRGDAEGRPVDCGSGIADCGFRFVSFRAHSWFQLLQASKTTDSHESTLTKALDSGEGCFWLTGNPVATARGSASCGRLAIHDSRLTIHEPDGSNAWAFAPGRTKSGRAILLRNPHLQWTAGYYEAHMTVPGVVDFYGDFRIGSPFAVIGGFNKYLGWSTTNNSQDLDEFYVLDTDPAKADHYLLDGHSHPLTRDVINVNVRTGAEPTTETREFWSTPFGPVVLRTRDKIYIVKFAGDGELRSGEQFLRMMRARSLEKWKDALKMRARPTSNFTYADKAGNIFFVWNASLPLLPHPVTDDLTAIPVKRSSEMWTRFVPFESLPQVLNPAGGYIHNENDSPHYTNVRGPVDTKNAYPNFESPDLSLRSQLAIQLIGGDQKYTLDDVWRLKHNYRMLTADRVKSDLIAAVKGTNPTGDIADAIALLERWDNTAAPDSRGATLFEEWWATYSGLRRPERQIFPNNQRFAKVWSVADPFGTPRGLADTKRAVESFLTAVAEVKRRFGAIDVTWGDVHRVRRGNVDVPVGGCGNDLGCFRVIGYTRAEDDKLVATAGDGWVIAVEFNDTPRAISVLAYGESSLPSSPWFSDQAEMFAKGEMKKVAFTTRDVDAGALKRYRPGLESFAGAFNRR